MPHSSFLAAIRTSFAYEYIPIRLLRYFIRAMPLERERSQGGMLAGGDFRPPFGRKYNRLPLDGETRITLLSAKETTCFFPCLPGRGIRGAGGPVPPGGFLGQSPEPPGGIHGSKNYAILSVIMPQTKQANSLAPAVTATFLCFPRKIIL